MEKNQGRKDDQDKLRFDLVPPHALQEVAKVLTFGAQKYGDENWRRLKDLQKRYRAAQMRHAEADRRGEDIDSESGMSHIAHEITCLLFILEDRLLKLKENEGDQPMSTKYVTQEDLNLVQHAHNAPGHATHTLARQDYFFYLDVLNEHLTANNLRMVSEAEDSVIETLTTYGSSDIEHDTFFFWFD